MKPASAPPAPERHPLRELLGRYMAVIRLAWQHRTELAGPARLSDEQAFLPAALSLQETPVHPAPRRLAWLIMGLFLLALAWASLGRVDIVAVATGRVVVSERSKIIQPLEASVVRQVLVRDGDHVVAGQVLVELDPTVASADKANVHEQYLAAYSEVLRTTALLPTLERSSQPALAWTDADARETEPAWRTQTQAQLLAEWQDIHAKRSKFEAEIARRRAEIVTAQETQTKLQTTLPLAQQRETDYQTLVGQGFISGHATQDKARERIELERDLATQGARLQEAQAALRESIQAHAAYLAETRRTLHERQFAAQSKRGQLQAEGLKADQRERLTQLTAPVAGVVQQLSVHSVGGVVTSAQPLMVIVPDSEEVTAIVQVANQDIGFVNAGQSAEIKLETFPYTQYGTVAATVSVLGGDAVTDEKTGISTYPATLTLHQRQLRVDGKPVAISPGMNVTAEIKTGQRRIIEYLTSPIQRARQESLRER